MRVAVEFGEEQLDFDIPDERVVGVWRGPPPVAAPEVKGLVLAGLENPLNFPPLRQAVVPGDRVVIPLGQDVPAVAAVLDAVVETLEAAGVEPSAIHVLAARPQRTLAW